MIIAIENSYDFHYEIIESVICNYDKIIKTNKFRMVKFLLKIIKNESFINYIISKYKNICIVDNFRKYNYYINCTVYEKDINNISNNFNHFYIAHEVTDKLKLPNIYFLTPLCKSPNYLEALELPFKDQIMGNKIITFIVQGDIRRRNMKLLEKILTYNGSYKFLIKILTRVKIDDKLLEKYSDKISVKYNLDFVDFHKEFLTGTHILPLITQKSHPQYYKNKLTSSINYGKAYNLTFLVDKHLQNIYKLEKSEVFNDENDILNIFSQLLEKYYKK